MLRRSVPLCSVSSSSSSDMLSKGKAAVNKAFGWYPVKGGEFLGNLLAGHNMFIQDIPKRFDKQHARHFSLVEGLTTVPLFSLAMVHYFSMFCQYPSRAKLVPVLMTELGKKTALQHEWMQVLQQKSPVDALAWRVAVLAMQVVLFPMCLLLSAIAPQLTHATMRFTNHILATKYECIASDKAPAFVGANVPQCQSAEDWHAKQMLGPTDFGAAIAMVIILYLKS